MIYALPEFASPWNLTLLLVLPLYTYFHFRKRSPRSTLKFPGTKIAARSGSSIALKLRHSLFVLRFLTLFVFIVALARPRYGEEIEEVTTEGVDIMLVLDVSESMIALDMLTDRDIARIGRKDAGSFYKSGQMEKHSRLGSAKRVIDGFISNRKHDRIGLVVFGANSFTQCPLTLDYGILRDFLKQVKLGLVNGSRTAIGSGMMTAINRLKDSPAKSKIIVLLTDGANNAGQVNPLTAAKIAKMKDIKVYTIGVGKRSGSRLELQQNPFTGQLTWTQVPIRKEEGVDAPTLEKISSLTNAKSYLATNQTQLEKIYETIDHLEKTEIHSNHYTKYKEIFPPFLFTGLIFLFLEILLANTRFLKIP